MAPTNAQRTREAQKRVDDEVSLKFSSPEWLNSPYRDHNYAVSRYRIRCSIHIPLPPKPYDDSGDAPAVPKFRVVHRYPVTRAEDIWEMLHRRRERVRAGNPYAAWDYVTCTLSEKELIRVADVLSHELEPSQCAPPM